MVFFVPATSKKPLNSTATKWFLIKCPYFNAMRKLLFILPMVMLTTCGTPDSTGGEASVPPEVNTFGWLTGHWQRGDDKPGRTTFEYWEKTTPALYAGLAYTMAEGDTVWQEDMRLYQTGSSWTLEVSGEGDRVPFESAMNYGEIHSTRLYRVMGRKYLLLLDGRNEGYTPAIP